MAEPSNIMCSKRWRSRCAGHLVGRADVVPEVDGHDREPAVLVEDDLEAIAGVYFERSGGAGAGGRDGHSGTPGEEAEPEGRP